MNETKKIFIFLLILFLMIGFCRTAHASEVIYSSGASRSFSEMIMKAAASPEELYGMTEKEIAEEEYYDSLELVANTVEAEASDDFEDKLAVCSVILNRYYSGDYESMEDVIYAPGQFQCTVDGGLERHSEISEETYAAVRANLDQIQFPDFWYFREDYSQWGTCLLKIGNHYFSSREE